VRTVPARADDEAMGDHESKVEGDGHQTYDPAKTKDINDSSGGTHSADDKGGK
jgi:hypothetical protein